MSAETKSALDDAIRNHFTALTNEQESPAHESAYINGWVVSVAFMTSGPDGEGDDSMYEISEATSQFLAIGLQATIGRVMSDAAVGLLDDD